MASARARRTLSLRCVQFVLVLTHLGVADVPPQHGFVDACSVSNQEDANTRCELCAGTADVVEKCRDRWRALGYTLGCRAHAKPEEVWCVKPGAATSQSPWLAVVGMAGVLGVALLLKRTLRGRVKK